MKKQLLPEQREKLLGALKARFEKNTARHRCLEWAKVQAKLEGFRSVAVFLLNSVSLSDRHKNSRSGHCKIDSRRLRQSVLTLFFAVIPSW